jgi:cytochrome c peroxidase
MPVPEDNPLTPEKIALGRRLFNDRRLSRDGSITCASCHNPDRAFSDDARPGGDD